MTESEYVTPELVEEQPGSSPFMQQPGWDAGYLPAAGQPRRSASPWPWILLGLFLLLLMMVGVVVVAFLVYSESDEPARFPAPQEQAPAPDPMRVPEDGRLPADPRIRDFEELRRQIERPPDFPDEMELPPNERPDEHPSTAPGRSVDTSAGPRLENGRPP